ncbi:hypothetical protein TNCV_1803661 [Trichonephila clavipes]|uniref:Uncharacterized protein n=1 Tax=Trichonephila clavipes TaxID=2585209 RepID=A0A8X6SL15_TRICX|nr:hypothetical protein TNCV_1803661 [Trichonephila clavipes]
MNAFVVNDLKVNKNTVVDWYMFCREVCMTRKTTRGSLATDHGQVTRSTPELAPSPNFQTTPFGRRLRIDIFNVHQLCGARLKLMTQVRYLDRRATKAT